jgi:hypothetical protein
MLTLALDVVTTDEAYVVYADIPGEAVWPSFGTGWYLPNHEQCSADTYSVCCSACNPVGL